MLLEYLESYVARIKPLFDLTGEMEGVKDEFELAWSEGNFPGMCYHLQAFILPFKKCIHF